MGEFGEYLTSEPEILRACMDCYKEGKLYALTGFADLVAHSSRELYRAVVADALPKVIS